MADRYRLHTPENVAVDYDLAGVGSRFIAAAIDTIVQVILIILVSIAISVAGGLVIGRGLLRDLDRAPDAGAAIWLVAVLLLVLFLLLWGYYVAFEMLWNGQTPGKRLTRLRVLRETGYPIGFLDSLIRNLVRIVDFLPFGYGVGVLTMLLDRRSRRLGDLAAGTIVVKERRGLRAADLLGDPLPPLLDGQVPDVPHVERLGAADYSLLREYLLRRERLTPQARDALALELGATLARRLDAPPPDDGLAADDFLEQVAAAYRARHAPR
jgi:uncharacterized RDD family membrane protein YckC